MSKDELSQAIYEAGLITGIMLRRSAQQWDQVAAEAFLDPVYLEHIRAISKLARNVEAAGIMPQKNT